MSERGFLGRCFYYSRPPSYPGGGYCDEASPTNSYSTLWNNIIASELCKPSKTKLNKKWSGVGCFGGRVSFAARTPRGVLRATHYMRGGERHRLDRRP